MKLGYFVLLDAHIFSFEISDRNLSEVVLLPLCPLKSNIHIVYPGKISSNLHSDATYMLMFSSSSRVFNPNMKKPRLQWSE